MEEGRAPKWGRTRSRAKKEKDATGEADNSKTNVYIEPDKEFPDRDEVVPAKPLTTTEKAQAAAYRRFRDRVHNGPLYTVLGDDARVAKPKGGRAFGPKVVDAFDGVETYSQRYTVRRRTLPKLNTRKYVHKFFPEELWSTIDPKLSSASKAKRVDKNRDKDTSARLQRAVDESAEASGGNKGAAEDGENDGAGGRDEEQADEVMDDDYATDDDDMGGDYNAEAYFDGGDDAGDDGDGERDEEY